MNNFKNARKHLISGLVFVILFAHLPVIYTMFYHNLTKAPKAINGEINLKNNSPARTIVLDGEWEFYWKRFISGDGQKDAEPDILIDVPGYWSKYKINGDYLPGEGYGSYKLTIKGLDYTDPVTIFIPDFGSAYRVFIDGRPASESGVLSDDHTRIHTVPKAKLYPVRLSGSDTHEVAIEVATTRFSGLYTAPVLKDYNRAVQEDINRNGIRFILFGTILFSFFILTVIYMLSFRNGRYSVWIPIMSLLMILRIMLTTEFYNFWQSNVFFNLSYEGTNKFMFLVTFALNFMLIFLVQEQFGIVFRRREKYGFLVFYIVVYLMFLFIPRDIYNRYLTILLPAAIFTLELHAFFKIYFGCCNLKKYGIAVYWGIVLAIAGLFIDCYYINGNIYPNMSLALLTMLSLCLMIFSMVSALQIAEVYRDLAVSASRLEQARNQISIQKEYYDALSGQMSEIRMIRHDMRHFIGVIRRLAEEGKYNELKQFLNQYSEKTETDSIPAYSENVVVNSILGYYSLKARDAGVPFYCGCSIPKQLSMNEIDLCIVLGNALENSIEACACIDDPGSRFISVEIRVWENKLLIKIENSYNGILNIQAGRYHSTKNEKTRGIGMQNIKKVVEAHSGFIKIDHDGKIFTLMAAFPFHK